MTTEIARPAAGFFMEIGRIEPPAGRFYGSLRPTVTLRPKRGMTAHATMFSSSGFVVASDGYQLLGSTLSADGRLRDGETDKAQKIFGFTGKRFTFACVLRGDVADQNRTYDAEADLRACLQPLAKKAADGYALALAIGTALESNIQRRALYRPRLNISLVGFQGRSAFVVELVFNQFPSESGLYWRAFEQEAHPGFGMFSGSAVISQLIMEGDSRIRHYITPWRDTTPTLQEAINTVKGYVEACCSPLGIQVDPENCRSLGGHIHVASVSPVIRPNWRARIFHGAQSTGGFTWVVAPQPR